MAQNARMAKYVPGTIIPMLACAFMVVPFWPSSGCSLHGRNDPWNDVPSPWGTPRVARRPMPNSICTTGTYENSSVWLIRTKSPGPNGPIEVPAELGLVFTDAFD